MRYWFNVDTGRVETDETRSRGATVMGPYDTEADASHALESARTRTEQWDAEDREWESGSRDEDRDED